MAVTVTDLQYPIGELMSSMFPDGDLDVNLALWLAEAQAKTTSDAAVKAWAYYRGFTAVALRIANTPTSERSFSDRSTDWSDGRVNIFQRKAQEHLDVFNGLVTAAGEKRPARMAVY